MDPDDPNYPAVGQGLNHPAKLTFYNTHHPDDISAEQFEAFLKDQSQKQGATFVRYDKASGTWVIRVPHFTRYGLESWDLARDSSRKLSREPSREQIDEARAKTPHLSQRAVKSASETDQEEIQRILSEVLATPLPFPEDSRGFSAVLGKNSLLSSGFSCIQTRSLPPTDSTFLQRPLRALIDACASVEGSELPTSVPQLCCPMGKELCEFLPRLQASFQSADPAPPIPAGSASSATAEVVRLPETPSNSMESQSSSTDWSYGSLYYSLFWELFALLFFSPSPAQRSRFDRWLERLLRSPLSASDAPLFESHDAFAVAAQNLLRHDVWAACEALRADQLERLAVQVAQISSLSRIGVTCRLLG